MNIRNINFEEFLFSNLCHIDRVQASAITQNPTSRLGLPLSLIV